MPEISHQFIIHSPVQRVFEAFCSSEGLNKWWTMECSGTPELNTRYRFYFGPEYDWEAKVTELVQNKRIVWKMTKAMDDWVPTEVGAEFAESGGVTTVMFFHRHWKKQNEHFAITSFCWAQLLMGLKNYCEKGIIVPFENRN